MDIYGVISVASITVFYGIYLAKQWTMRRRGIDTARLGKGVKPRGVRLQECVLAFVTVAVAVVQYATVFSRNSIFPVADYSLPLRFAGAVVCVVGTVYFGAAVFSMRRNWRAGIDSSQKTSLVETGIYRFSRNPAFVGFDLMYAGFAMVWPDWLLITLSATAMGLFHLQILREEKFLEARFGDTYAEYRKRTLRY